MDETPSRRIGHPRDQARQIVTEYFAGNPPMRLPIPAEEIAEFFGFEVYRLDSLNNHQRAILKILRDENRKLIGLNSRFHRHSQRFSIGHELGHYFLGHPYEEDCTDDQIRTFNQEADEFSAELLMPFEVVKQNLKEGVSPTKLAAILDVSEEALWRKIQNQKLLDLIK